MSASGNLELNKLDQLSQGEDEFDVDLMGAGCRLATAGPLDLSVADLLRLYNFDEPTLAAFVGALIDRAKLDPQALYDLANQAARGQLKEPAGAGSKK